MLPEFERRLKQLGRKYRTLPDDIDRLLDKLEVTPRLGESLGAGLYKIRLGSVSKGGGKSGGFRIITYCVTQTAEGETVYLVTIYDKSEEEGKTKQELLAQLRRELPNSAGAV